MRGRRSWSWAVAFCVAALLWGCGSTTDEDQLVLEFLGFEGEGIEQADRVGPGAAEVDVIPSCCSVDTATGLCTEAELFTETAANALFTNHQKADITIDRYEVEILGASLGVFEGSGGGQVVPGRRCQNDPTRPCATDADCGAAVGIAGGCVASVSSVHVLLFDFSTKQLILPDVEPFGRTFPVEVRFEASDLAGGKYRIRVPFQARFDNFDNCEVTQ
ncbi:MAG: hypothetical protein KatS3mg076_1004 [Candidatus Binatia bacterium]|nr:MAG: hypothetical protein KatS3mg076_1004 [Candidatus Binatia bacterium]